jgi:amidase
VGAVVTLDVEGARARAKEADRALARGEMRGPLHGVGVTIEDIHATAGMRSTFGGYRPFAGHVRAVDATVAARLKASAAIVVGKTNGPCLWGGAQHVRADQEPVECGPDGRGPRQARRWRWPRA